MGGSWDMPNRDSEPGKVKWLPKETWKNASHMWFKLSRGHNFLPETACMSIHTYPFILLIKTFLVPLLFWLCENSFLQSQGARALSLTSGLVASIQHSHCHGLTSVFIWKLKSCFKPLQAEAHWDQMNMYFVILFRRKLASLLLKTIFTWVIQPPLKTYQQQ